MPQQPDIHVYTIPAGAPFARALARGFAQRFGLAPDTLASASIYLPTSRAARLFADSFARELDGALLLPRFATLSEADSDETGFDPEADDFVLTPAIGVHRRRLLLASLIQRWHLNRHGADGAGALSFDQAVSLAASLASVMDEVETAGADLARLDELAPETLAAHWGEVKDFLGIISTVWPDMLAAEKAVNPAAHRNAALARLAARLAAHPPAGPVIAAGSTGSVPATADLMAAIAALPMGAVVLPGLDQQLDDAAWASFDPGHPQYSQMRLLQRLGVDRAAVENWCDMPGNRSREKLLSEVLRPAPATDAWRTLAEQGPDSIAPGLVGLTLEEAADPAEEAETVALYLRETLQTPGKTAALVTRDRDLARRVAVLCRRWNILLDDSAGQRMPLTRAGSFLCLLAEAADADFAPAEILALFKHPLASRGGRADFLQQTRALDLLLRGPRPDPGLGGIAAAIAAAADTARPDEAAGLTALAEWFADVASVLAPFADQLGQAETSLRTLIDAHIAAAEALCATTGAGDIPLWAGADGDAASRFLAGFTAAADGLPDIDCRSYARLFRQMLDAHQPVRPSYGRHPRLAILSPQEARLQSYDRLILAGLNEGIWPAPAPADPWFSRPMRRTLGLEQPERAIGLSAHDFALLAAGPEVILTRALKQDGAPAVSSRWLQRLLQLTRGLGLETRLTPATPFTALARAISAVPAVHPCDPPAPRPPVAARPRRMSVTEIETWLRDPYAIYARHVLGLRALDPIDADIGPMERGSILHKSLELFVRAYPGALPDNPAAALTAIAEQVFAEARTPKAVLALWRPRFLRAALWFAELEVKRRAAIAESFVEIKGQRDYAGPGGPFRLVGKADRIDRLKSGGAAILDYKTGAPPSEKQVVAQLSPQLPLEAALLAASGFKEIGPLKAAELIYIRLTGGETAGEYRPLKADAMTLAADAEARLIKRIGLFDDPSTAYDSRVAPMFAKGEGDFDHLARVKEWSMRGWGDDV